MYHSRMNAFLPFDFNFSLISILVHSELWLFGMSEQAKQALEICIGKKKKNA